MARSLGEAEVRVTANVTKMAVQIRAAITAAVRGAGGDLTLNVDSKGLRERIRAALAAALNPNPTIVFDIDVNTKTATARLAALSVQASKSETKTINVDVDRGLASVGRMTRGLLGGVGAIGKFTAALTAGAAGAQGLGVVLAGLVSITGQLAGGLVVLPGILAGIVGVVAGLKLGFTGVGDALKNAFDPTKAEQFSEAMAKLSPRAQETVRAIQGLGPAFKSMRIEVQEQLFENLGGRITQLGQTYIPILESNLRRVTAAFNAGAQGTLDFLNGGLATAQVGAILGNTTEFAKGLGGSLQPIVEGLLAIANVGSGQLPGLGQAIENVSIKFRNWATTARDNGQLQAMIDNAKVTLTGLGTVASNIGQIIGQMWTVAGQSGGTFLDSLISGTDALNTFLHTAQGVSLLSGIFTTLSSLALVFRAALGAILPALAPIAAAFGGLAQSVGGALVGAFATLSPVLAQIGGVFGQLITLVAPFAAQLISTLAPVLAQVGGLVVSVASTLIGALGPVLPVIAQAFAAVATAVGPVIAALGGALGPVIAALAPVLGQIAQVLSGVLVQAFAALAPILPIIGQALSAIVTAFGPLIGAAVQLAGTLLSALLPALGPIAQIISTVLVQAFGILTPIITALTPVIGQLAGLFAGILMQALTALAPIFPVIAQAATQILGAFLPLLPVVAQLAQAVLPPLLSIFLALVPAIIPLVQAIGQILTAIISILAPIIQVAAAILGAIVGMAAGVIAVVAGFVAGVIGFFASLLGGIVSIVGSIVGGVLGFFANLASGVINMVGGFVSGVLGFFGAMLGGVLGAVSSLVGGVLGAIGSMISGALGALSDWVGRMVGIGVDLVNGIVRGLQSAAGAVIDFLIGLARDALASVKSFLGIASPSRVFAEVGKNVALGMVVGMDGGRSGVIASAQNLARAATAAADREVAVNLGSVSQAVWDRLRGMGYKGRAGDNREALYVPQSVLDQVTGRGVSAGQGLGRGLAAGIVSTQPVVIRAAEAMGRATSDAIGRTVRLPDLGGMSDDLGRKLAQQGIVTSGFDVGSLVRPTREAQQVAPPPVDPDGLADAVRQGTYDALNGSELRVSGTGLARLVNEGNRDLARR